MSTNTSVAIKKYHPVRAIMAYRQVAVINTLWGLGIHLRKRFPRNDLYKVISSLPKPQIAWVLKDLKS
jgi:hypothetical protein